MARPNVLIFHRPAQLGESALAGVLVSVRAELAERQSDLFRRAGSGRVRVLTVWPAGLSFGEVLASLAPARGGLIVMSSGAVPRLSARDAEQLVVVAGSGRRQALTNNRYSSDVCAVGRAEVVRDLPPLPSDNALPRWLEEVAGFAVAELAGRERLALDIDTPLDIALAALAPGAANWLSTAAERARLSVPRYAQLRALTADPMAELLVAGRSGSRTLAWLERNVRCRVRFLAEERGLRAASPLAIAGATVAERERLRPPRSALGRLLEQSGPAGLAEVVANLADGAIVDTRVLLAHRLGGDESAWSSAGDRYASDLHRPAEIGDPWLRELTESAAASQMPILLGAHSLVGPGVRILLAGSRARTASTLLTVE